MAYFSTSIVNYYLWNNVIRARVSIWFYIFGTEANFVHRNLMEIIKILPNNVHIIQSINCKSYLQILFVIFIIEFRLRATSSKVERCIFFFNSQTAKITMRTHVKLQVIINLKKIIYKKNIELAPKVLTKRVSSFCMLIKNQYTLNPPSLCFDCFDTHFNMSKSKCYDKIQVELHIIYYSTLYNV